MIQNCKNCKKEFQARQADINRGWGLFCSKSCKAKHQENKTGQYKSYLCSRINGMSRRYREDDDIESHEEDPSWDAHKDVF